MRPIELRRTLPTPWAGLVGLVVGFASLSVAAAWFAALEPGARAAPSAQSTPIETQSFEDPAFPPSGWEALDLWEEPGQPAVHTWGRETCETAPGGGNAIAWSVRGGSSGSALGCLDPYMGPVISVLRYGPIDTRPYPGGVAVDLLFKLEAPSAQSFTICAAGPDTSFGCFGTGLEQTEWASFASPGVVFTDAANEEEVWIEFLYSAIPENPPAHFGVLIDLVEIVGLGGSLPTATSGPSPTASATTTSTPNAPASPTATSGPTRPPTLTPPPTATGTALPSATATPAQSATPSNTPLPTTTPRPSLTPSPSATMAPPTATVPTATPATPTAAFTRLPTRTATPQPTPSIGPSATSTAMPSGTPEATATDVGVPPTPPRGSPSPTIPAPTVTPDEPVPSPGTPKPTGTPDIEGTPSPPPPTVGTGTPTRAPEVTSTIHLPFCVLRRE